MLASAGANVRSSLTAALWVSLGASGASYQEAKAETEILLPLPKAKRTKGHCQEGQEPGCKNSRLGEGEEDTQARFAAGLTEGGSCEARNTLQVACLAFFLFRYVWKSFCPTVVPVMRTPGQFIRGSSCIKSSNPTVPKWWIAAKNSFKKRQCNKMPQTRCIKCFASCWL